MGITWGPFKEFGSAAKAFGETEATRKRQKMLDRVKVLSDLRRAGYRPTDMQDMAIDVEGFGKFEPVREFEKATGRLKEFELATGALEHSRGTDQYQKDYLEWEGKVAKARTQPVFEERERDRRRMTIGELKQLAAVDPNRVYSHHGYRMNDDGTLYIEPTTKAPVKLPTIPEVLGKRANIEILRRIGEQWDDAKQIVELLRDEDVVKDLSQGLKETDNQLWDSVANKISNTFRHWMQKKGIGRTSKISELIGRIQRYASQERLKFLGQAVTETEIQSVLAWLPNAGDSLPDIWAKIRIAAFEGEEELRRYLDIYKNMANMGPVYDVFGIDRFSSIKKPTPLPVQPPFMEPEIAWIVNPDDPSGPPIKVKCYGELDEYGEKIWYNVD